MCNSVATKILRRFYAFFEHNRFLLSDARFIALPLYNRFFYYPIPYIIDSLNIRRIFVATLMCYSVSGDTASVLTRGDGHDSRGHTLVTLQLDVNMS